MGALKKFISNKNTVTIFGIILGLVVLYVGYNYRVNKKVTFINVLYAKQAIPSNTQITPEMIGTMKVNSEILKASPNIVRSMQEITDSKDGSLYYVDFDSNIPKGSFLYSTALVSENDKADSKLYRINSDKRYVYFEVDLETTLGNVIGPGDSIDIYAYMSGEEKIFGKLYSNVHVIDVVDGSWNTTTGSKEKSPDLLIALVSEEDYQFMEKAKRISGIELIPAQNDKPFDQTDGATEISSTDIKYQVESQFSNVS